MDRGLNRVVDVARRGNRELHEGAAKIATIEQSANLLAAVAIQRVSRAPGLRGGPGLLEVGEEDLAPFA